MPLTPLGIRARDHWQIHRPAAYAQLEAEDRVAAFFENLEATAQAAWDTLEESLIAKGHSPAEAASIAEEIILREHILLPAE